jgi:hypothetical protein
VSANESASAEATDVDSAGVARLVNAMLEDRIPVIHRLGIRIVEVRDGFIAGAAPLAGNLNYQGFGPPPKQVKALTYPVSSDGGRTVSSRGSVSALIRRCAVNSSLS